jgi:hypothetical protein
MHTHQMLLCRHSVLLQAERSWQDMTCLVLSLQ